MGPYLEFKVENKSREDTYGLSNSDRGNLMVWHCERQRPKLNSEVHTLVYKGDSGRYPQQSMS